MRTRSSHKPTSLDPTYEAQKRLVLPEIGAVVGLDDDTCVRSLYHNVAQDSAIDVFLRKSRLYNSTQRRWKLPRSGAKLLNNDFYTPFLNVFSSIIKHFWKGSTAEGMREMMDTHSIDLSHRETDSSIHHSRPSLVIKAQGPSFQLPYARDSDHQVIVGYSNIATCIEIQLEKENIRLSDQLVRVAIYARQIFIHQPNRLFVRILVVSEQHVRLFHFDRSGVQYTPLLNFHGNPHIFVRLVLGLSSPEESDIGLDESIKWTTRNGRKVSGTLETRAANNEFVVYPLTAINPLFSNGNIRSRTVCWSARDPTTGESLVVKDSWRSEERMSEHLFLQDAVGVAGVVQMVACEPDRRNTKSLRGLGNLTPAGFRNRIETRMVIKAYGKSIKKYASAKQLFCALRDAIAGMDPFAILFLPDTHWSGTSGHLGLFNKGILHRDVSPHNILLGKPDAEPGDRGILIDFDIALRRSLNKLADCQMGTRLYQSVSVLKSCTSRYPLPYDHLDDLESFLYVLVHIMWNFDSNGAPQPDHEMLLYWEENSGTCSMLGTLKSNYLSTDYVPIDIQDRWPSPCVDLIIAFNTFIDPLMMKKRKLSQWSPVARKGEDNVFARDATQHYTHILNLFDTAIDALDRPDTWRVYNSDDESSYISDSCCESPARGVPRSPSAPPKSGFLKRVSDETYPDGQPPAKSPNCIHSAGCSS
ncbi:hypothetical protein MD484_g8335, partial [Candolleomyces efflorescens]